MTDATVSPRSRQSALTYAIGQSFNSFNSFSVDGEMTTNDSINVLANRAQAVSGVAYEIFSAN